MSDYKQTVAFYVYQAKEEIGFFNLAKTFSSREYAVMEEHLVELFKAKRVCLHLLGKEGRQKLALVLREENLDAAPAVAWFWSDTKDHADVYKRHRSGSPVTIKATPVEEVRKKRERERLSELLDSLLDD